MADLGSLPTILSTDSPYRIFWERKTVRVSYIYKALTIPGWDSNGHVVLVRSLYRTRQTPAWWGTLPPGATPLLPDYELRGRVLQHIEETDEDVPLANARVVLFFRRTNYVIDLQVSDEDGYVVFPNIMPGNQAYFAIAFDPEGSPMQNSILWDRLTSVPGD